MCYTQQIFVTEECYGEDARTDGMKVKDCEELQMQKEDEVDLLSLVEFPDKYPTWGWCVQIVFDKMTMCPDSLAPEERPDDPQPRHHRLHHRPPVSGVTTIKDQHSRYQTLSRFTFTFQVHFYPVSGIWELRISRLGEEDGGEYCCQVGESCELWANNPSKVTSPLSMNTVYIAAQLIAYNFESGESSPPRQ